MQISIDFPIDRDGIQKLSRQIYTATGRKEDLVNLSIAVHAAKAKKYPRTKREKYGNLPRGFIQEELKEFFSLFKPHEFRFRFYCLWSIWWGGRQGEVHKLNLDDIKFDSQSVIIYREKGEGPQEFKIEDSLWLELTEVYIKQYEKEIKAADGHIFFSRSQTQRGKGKAKYWSSGWLRRTFREVLSRSDKFSKTYDVSDCWHPKASKRKLYQFTLHSLRYTFAYLAIDFFHDPTIVQELMAHKKIDSTMHYLRNYRKTQAKEFSTAMQKETILKQFI